MTYYDDYDCDDLEADDEPVLAPRRPPLDIDRLVTEALARLDIALSTDVVRHLHEMRGGRLPAGVLSVHHGVQQDFVEVKEWGGHDFITQRVPTTRQTVAVVTTLLRSPWFVELHGMRSSAEPKELTGLYLPGRWFVLSADMRQATREDAVVDFRLAQVWS